MGYASNDAEVAFFAQVIRRNAQIDGYRRSFTSVNQIAVSFPVLSPNHKILRLSASSLLLMAGCAFDISHVKQLPANFTVAFDSSEEFILNHDLKIPLGSGFPTRLKAGTRWRQVGQIPQGDVFATKDQIVTVEASNTWEALLVVANRCITGFYLPGEKTFVTTVHPIPIQTQPIETKQP